jgi:3-methyl-2-oxobutanoate hydroxymethyltransferase
MSSQAGSGSMSERITVPLIVEKKRKGQKIAAITAYDAPTGRMVDAAQVDLVLVGDSLSNVVLGRPNTLSVTMDEMLHHTRAVTSQVLRALVVGDMPFGSYHVQVRQAIENAGRFIKEGGAAAVKLEGPRHQLVRAIVEAEIEVMGHLGLTPQSVHRMGGYRVQGTTPETQERLMEAALRIEDAGAFAIVLEGVPRELAAAVTARLRIPTIGIGAGPDCDGQILVLHDLLGMLPEKPPKFVRRYASLYELGKAAVAAYVRDVELARFPSDKESYRGPSTTVPGVGRDAPPKATEDDWI